MKYGFSFGFLLLDRYHQSQMEHLPVLPSKLAVFIVLDGRPLYIAVLNHTPVLVLFENYNIWWDFSNIKISKKFMQLANEDILTRYNSQANNRPPLAVPN